MAKEKSISWSRSNSSRLAPFSSRQPSTASVSAGVSAAVPSSGLSSPSMRTSGTEGTLRCRSDPPISTRARSAAWTSNMILVLGVWGGWLSAAAARLDERPRVPGDELRADEHAGDAAQRQERAEGDLGLAGGGHALARGDHRAGGAAGQQRDEHGGG